MSVGLRGALATKDGYAGSILNYVFYTSVTGTIESGIGILQTRKSQLIELGIAIGTISGGSSPTVVGSWSHKTGLGMNNATKGTIIVAGASNGIVCNASNTYAVRRWAPGSLIIDQTGSTISTVNGYPCVLNSVRVELTGSPTSVSNVSIWAVTIPLLDRV